MAEKQHSQVGRLFNYANNPITITGAVLTTLSAILICIFITIHMLGGHQSAYTGILAFAILPGLFVTGLLIIPFGMWLRRRRLMAAHLSEAEMDAFPRLDFNDPHLRRVVLTFLMLTFVNAVLFGSASFIGVEYMESVEFCGTVCHTVMAPEYAAYQNSPHSRVRCVQCHIGPGASWFVKSKIDGLRQVIATTLDTYSRPIHTPIHNLRPAQATCEQCHWPSKHHGDKLHVLARHETDEENTPSYTALLLKTGGGDLDQGRHGGIHWWHIYSDNRIRFIPGDARRMTVNWVELTTPDGEVRTYMREGEEPPGEGEMTEAKTMDCIDCHNRPTHLFQRPDRSLDEALEKRTDLRGLPFYKREAKAAIEAEYATNAEGTEAVGDAILRFYRTEYPDIFEKQRAIVDQGAATASAIYARTVFPQMNSNWNTHPNHIGHPDPETDEGSLGCWRCHDDELVTADGEHSIPQDCDNCHTFLFEDLPELPDLETATF